MYSRRDNFRPEPFAAVKNLAASSFNRSMECKTASTAWLSMSGPITFFSSSGGRSAPFVSGQKFLAHFVGDRLMQDDATGGSQRWPPCRRRRRRSMRRHLQISARADDECFVAAQFHDGSAETAVHRFRDLDPHAPKPVAENQGNPSILGQLLPTVTRSPVSNEKIAGSAPVARQTRSAILVRRWRSGASSPTASRSSDPHKRRPGRRSTTRRHRKINAEMTATRPSGCHCS